MDALNLNAGVSLKTLYKNLTAEQLNKVEEFSKDGFTEDELQQLEQDGIDTSLIKENSSKGDKSSVAQKAAEIKEKYCSNLEQCTGDKYSTKNPELNAFSQALDDGLMEELGKAGYSKSEIIEIISQAFPSIGIKNKEGDNYECPYGHGNDAKEIYNKFLDELTKATNLNSQELIEARNKLSQINIQITENNRQLKSLEYNITMLQDSIEEKIEDAIDESEDIVEDQKEDAKGIVSKRLNEYTSSNGDMTYEEFQKSVASDLDELSGGANSKLSGAVAKILSAQKDMNVLSGYMNKMNNLVSLNKDLSSQASQTQAEIKDLTQKALEESEADECCKRCDPIGFSDAEGVRYDFFVDKDSDGNVTNENEFLGAENGFNEMINADANGDGQVTAEELDAKNVKVVVTNKDGSQEIKNASEVFKQGDSINLSSYQAQNTELENGNALLGTFSVNKDGQSLDTGYQTLDKLDWLDDNFEFSDEINGVGRHMRSEDEVVEALDYSDKYNIFAEGFSKLQQKEEEAERKLGLDKSELKDGISSAAEKDAARKGEAINNIFMSAKQNAENEEVEEQEAQEAIAQEETAAEEEIKEQELEEEN